MPQRFPFGLALLPICATVLSLGATLVIWHASLFWPALAIGALVAAGIARYGGMAWGAIGRAAVSGVRSAWIALAILLLVGALIGVWKAAGTVPALVYYGLQLVVPQYLVPMAFLLALGTSMLLGTSIGTLSTLGVAVMGIAHGVGAPLPLVAGALSSGALFGDRSSPLSGSLALNVAMTGIAMRPAMRALLPTGLTTLALSLVGYWLLGRHLGLTTAGSGGVREAIARYYGTSLWLLLPPVLVLGLSLARVPVLRALAIGILMGMVLAVMVGHQPLLAPVQAAVLGNHAQTGSPELDRLFAGGGLISMVAQVTLLVAAGAMNGIMDASGMMAVVIERLIAGVRRPLALVAVTMATSAAVSAVAANQALTIILPGRMLRGAFTRMGLPPARLSRAVADSGTVLSGLVPWNVMGLLAGAALGVPARVFAPYALFAWLLPLVSFVWAAIDERGAGDATAREVRSA